MTTETTTTRKTSNVIFLIQGTDGNEEIVQTFRPSETKGAKSPKRALTNFLNLVLGDADHELHEAAQSGDLSWMSGHTQPVSIATKTVVSF